MVPLNAKIQYSIPPSSDRLPTPQDPSPILISVLQSLDTLPSTLSLPGTSPNTHPYFSCVLLEDSPLTPNPSFEISPNVFPHLPNSFFYLTHQPESFTLLQNANLKAVLLPATLSHLSAGDIIRIDPSNQHLRVLFKPSLRQHSFLLTERCNNFCIMCSQPPRDIDDSYLTRELLQILPLLPKNIPEIGFTGGEPTLCEDAFFELVAAAKTHLPNTALHILSNGRTFANPELAQKLAAINHPDLMLGVPLYADNAADHNHVVQADAFEETIQGILNLKRNGIRTELRVVLHSFTLPRLHHLATYITRNLLFIDQVALMGLEAMGFGKTNFQALWPNPQLLSTQLEETLQIFQNAKIKALVYNLPLCLLGPLGKQHSTQSISDWKNEYLPACDSCSQKAQCCGFFSSTKHHYSPFITPFS